MGIDKIDYSKPIFVYYINVAGLSRQQAEKAIQSIVEDFDQMDVQMWFVPVGETSGRSVSIECIWNPMGGNNNDDESTKKLVADILEIIEGVVDDNLKGKVREILLGRLLNGESL